MRRIEMFIYVNNARAFAETWFQVFKILIICNFYVVATQENRVKVYFCCREHKESPRLHNYVPPSLPSSQIWQSLNNGLKWYMLCVFLFCNKNSFAIHLYLSDQDAIFFVSFPIQTALGAQLGFATQ